MTEKFLVYDVKEDADKAVSNVWEAYKTDMEAKGFPVVNGEIVGKNALTGEPDYEAQRTTQWDEVKETNDGKFFMKEPPPELKTAIEAGKYVEVDTKPEQKDVIVEEVII